MNIRTVWSAVIQIQSTIILNTEECIMRNPVFLAKSSLSHTLFFKHSSQHPISPHKTTALWPCLSSISSVLITREGRWETFSRSPLYFRNPYTVQEHTPTNKESKACITVINYWYFHALAGRVSYGWTRCTLMTGSNDTIDHVEAFITISTAMTKKKKKTGRDMENI